jgi:hypothetical protein
MTPMHQKRHILAKAFPRIAMIPFQTRITKILARFSSEIGNILQSVYSDSLSSDVESLKKGIIKSNNEAQVPYTILLVGETGVGKSSVLEFIANVLIGNDINHYDFDILDHGNEAGGSSKESQTNSARLYQLTSKSGMEVGHSLVERNQRN